MEEKTTDTAQLAARFAGIENEIKRLESEVEELKTKKKEIEIELLDKFIDSGTQNTKVNGRIIYVKREVWAGHNGDVEAFCDSMEKAGLGGMVKRSVNSQTFSAYVRELENNELSRFPDKKKDGAKGLSEEEIKKLLPKELHEVVKVTEVIKLASRKG